MNERTVAISYVRVKQPMALTVGGLPYFEIGIVAVEWAGRD
jgi:hypothetical protein